ncbi:PDC sensor domain-containing protein, partial [Clostridium botulinum]|nr:PDC sensor domain-containing protein [Clostridium botulinum]
MSGKAAISDIIISAVTKKPTIIVASPIIKSGQIREFLWSKGSNFFKVILLVKLNMENGLGIIVNG